MRGEGMDPDVTHGQLRELAEAINDPQVRIQSGIEAAEGMAEGFEALDEWLGKGGFLPEKWEHESRRRLTVEDFTRLTQEDMDEFQLAFYDEHGHKFFLLFPTNVALRLVKTVRESSASAHYDEMLEARAEYDAGMRGQGTPEFNAWKDKITAEERADMAEAHAHGLHDDAPRQFCPECEGS